MERKKENKINNTFPCIGQHGCGIYDEPFSPFCEFPIVPARSALLSLLNRSHGGVETVHLAHYYWRFSYLFPMRIRGRDRRRVVKSESFPRHRNKPVRLPFFSFKKKVKHDKRRWKHERKTSWHCCCFRIGIHSGKPSKGRK